MFSKYFEISNSFIKRDNRPETLMCYFGYHGNFTPMHQDAQNSSAFNLAVMAGEGAMMFWFIVCVRQL
jgi:hypothetical protein